MSLKIYKVYCKDSVPLAAYHLDYTKNPSSWDNIKKIKVPYDLLKKIPEINPDRLFIDGSNYEKNPQFSGFKITPSDSIFILKIKGVRYIISTMGHDYVYSAAKIDE